MNQLKAVILLGFALMFAAGLAVGRSRTPAAQPPASDDAFGHLREQLNLSPAQHEQIQKIWRDARSHADTLAHQIHDADHNRDDAIKQLLTPEQRQAFDKIQQERDARITALRGEMAHTMQDAEKNVRALMTPEQLKKFDEIARQHRHHHGPSPMMGTWRPRHGEPSTAPAAPTTAPAPAPGN